MVGENLCMLGISMSENLETPCTPSRMITGRDAQGRQKPHAWDGRHGESYRLVVRRKLPNKSASGENPGMPRRRRRRWTEGAEPRREVTSKPLSGL